MANENPSQRPADSGQRQLPDSGPDPIANTQAFRAFAGEEPEAAPAGSGNRTLLAVAVAVAIVVVILLIWLFTR